MRELSFLGLGLPIPRLCPAALLRSELLGFETAVIFGERQSPPCREGHGIAEHAGKILVFIRRGFRQPANHFCLRYVFSHNFNNISSGRRLIKLAEELFPEFPPTALEVRTPNEEMVFDSRVGENMCVERRRIGRGFAPDKFQAKLAR